MEGRAVCGRSRDGGAGGTFAGPHPGSDRGPAGEPHLRDPRVEQAVRQLAHAASLETLAADADLSASWLRRLARSAIGIPLARLRQWARLRDAVAALGDASLADAAQTAGFTDQAHMTRLARRLLGRTPGSLKVAVAPGAPGNTAHGRPVQPDGRQVSRAQPL